MFNRTIKRIAIYTFFILLIIQIVLLFLKHFFELYLLWDIVPYILGYIILFSVFFIFNKSKIRNFMIYPVLIILILIYSFRFILRSEEKDFYFKSPRGTNTIIIEECTFLLGGWSNVYIPKYVIFKKLLPQYNISADNGGRPFTNNDYSMNWKSENVVVIKYDSYTGTNNIKTITISLK